MSSKKTRFIPIEVEEESKTERRRKEEDEKEAIKRPPFCEIIFEDKNKVVIDDLDCFRKLKMLFRLDSWDV